MITTDVGGRAELRHVQAKLTAGPKKLQAALGRNTRAAVAPLQTEIPAESLARMPSGYGPILARAIKVTSRVTTASAVIKAVVKVKASGKKDERDVRALNAGVLRHPLFGNRSRGNWHDQRVRRGFIDDPIAETKKRVIKGALDAVDEFADSIERG